MREWLPRLVARAPIPVHLKLISAFFVIVALLIIFGVIVHQVLAGINERSEDLDRLRHNVVVLYQFQRDSEAQLYNVTAALLSAEEQHIENALQHLRLFRFPIEGIQEGSAAEFELIRKIAQEQEELIGAINYVADLTRGLEITKAIELRRTTVVPLSDHLELLIKDLVGRAEAKMQAKMNEGRRDYLTSRWVVIGFALGSIGLAVLLGYAVSASLTGPVTLMDRRLGQIASGDFSKQVVVQNRDELGTLAKNLNRMSVELQGLYQQIEDASRHKSDFLASMSHELRTPLNAIIGYSEMLIAEAADRGQQDLVSDLGKIRASGKHLLTLINDILDLSKIEAGKIELSPETFDVSGLIRDVASMVQPLIEKNGNVLVINQAADLGTLFADSTRVRQILFNLLSNAGKFTKTGTITLDAEREQSVGGERLRLQISDTGIGMTSEQLEKMFRPFSQADIATSRKYGGTGLGLAITKQFCEMMGGAIAVTSEYGRGTIFTVKLPYVTADEKPALSVPAMTRSEMHSHGRGRNAEDTSGRG